MGEQGKCKFCGGSRDLYKPTCQSCKGKLPKYNYKNVYREQGIKQGRLQALDEVEKMCEQMKVETGYKGCLRDFYGYNKALSNIKKEIAKLRKEGK